MGLEMIIGRMAPASLVDDEWDDEGGFGLIKWVGGGWEDALQGVLYGTVLYILVPGDDGS
jgi:hypothetical protein